jgi:hypothetical protein
MQCPIVVQGREMNEEKARRLSGWIAGRTRYANQKRSGRVPPDTNVLDLGARVQAQAMGLGLARAKEVFIVAMGHSGYGI